MSTEKTIEQKEIVVERTHPEVLDKMYDFYTENYGYFIHKAQMDGLGIKPTTMNNFNGNKRMAKGKSFKPITRKRTFTPRIPKALPPKVAFLKKEFKFVISKAYKECANEYKYYQKAENWINAHQKLTDWERKQIYGYRMYGESILVDIIEKTGNTFRLMDEA